MPVAIRIAQVLFFLLVGRCYPLGPGIVSVAAKDSILVAVNDSTGYFSYDYGATFDSVAAPAPPFSQGFVLADGNVIFTYEGGAKFLVVPGDGPARIETGGGCYSDIDIDGLLHQIDYSSRFLCIDAEGASFGIRTIEAGLGKVSFTESPPMDWGVRVNRFEYLDSAYTLMIGSVPRTHGYSTLFLSENGTGNRNILSQLDGRGFSQYWDIRRMSKDIVLVMTSGSSFLVSNDNGRTFPVKGSFAPFDYFTSHFLKDDYYLLFTPIKNNATTMVIAEVWFDPLQPTAIRKASQTPVSIDGTTLFTAKLGRNRVALITDLGAVKILEWDPLPLAAKAPRRKARSFLSGPSRKTDAMGRHRKEPDGSRVRYFDIPARVNP